MPKPGLYEQLINSLLSRELDCIADDMKYTEAVDSAEEPALLAAYIAAAVRKKLEGIPDSAADDRLRTANEIIKTLGEPDAQISEPAEMLRTVLGAGDPRALTPGIREIPRPETSISMSSLFTGSAHEPAMFTELKKEIATSDRIDMLVSFIKFSGLRMIIDELRAFTARGGLLRVITTSYMGATDVKAVEELSKLPNTDIRISYDTKRTRLHAKAYVFHRDSGFTTAYIGSSNLSNAAISSGMEWNLKITAKDQPDILRKIAATFDTYLNSDEFEKYTSDSRQRLSQAIKDEKYHGERTAFVFDIKPYPYQQEILDRLRAQRVVHHSYRNLVVAATGTGKTVISAFDYKSFRQSGGPCRLMFIAHREEILKQSLDTFRGVLKDANFGDMWVGSAKPESLDHIFISVQTLSSQKLWEHLDKDFFDYIVVDETHHAAAESYDRALTYFEPKILLGLTATPERMDGRDIRDYFDGKIASEIRLPEAIERKLLCPFQYFGVSDTIDLTGLKWVRGGYDKGELSKLYSMHTAGAEKRARHIITQLDKYTTDMDALKALGFCVSVEHAHFMSEMFNSAGIPSIALDGRSSDSDRQNARARLVSGDIKVIFAVDLYNEGVDIPEVNTVLFLRPTESLTIFLQQFGRGLRLSEGKDCLTVLDFIGAANRKYNFEQKLRAMLSAPGANVSREIQRGFVSVPRGCYISLEKKARDYILNNIKASYNARQGLISKIASFTDDTGTDLTLASFLTVYDLDPRAVYKYATFRRLCAEAELMPPVAEPENDAARKALYRLSLIDSRRWIEFLLDVLDRLDIIDPVELTREEQLMLSMFSATVADRGIDDFTDNHSLDLLRALAKYPEFIAEMRELLKYRFDRVDFIDSPNGLPYPCPLDVHCTYSRDQLLCGLGFTNYNSVREGVKRLENIRTDVLFITLNKSDKEYSPTTMYNDYAVNSRLFHWQSQSLTSAESVTGQRYKNHRSTGDHILLFVREAKKDEYGTAYYTFLGEAEHVSSEGSKPMNILWSLKAPIPAKFLRKVQQVIG